MHRNNNLWLNLPHKAAGTCRIKSIPTPADWQNKHIKHTKRFKLSVEHFDALNYVAVSLYKLGIVLFNLVPFLALHIAY